MTNVFHHQDAKWAGHQNPQWRAYGMAPRIIVWGHAVVRYRRCDLIGWIKGFQGSSDSARVVPAIAFEKT